MHRTGGVPDDFPPFPTCPDCGNQVNTDGQYVTAFERIVLEYRAHEDTGPDDGAVTE